MDTDAVVAILVIAVGQRDPILGMPAVDILVVEPVLQSRRSFGCDGTQIPEIRQACLASRCSAGRPAAPGRR